MQQKPYRKFYCPVPEEQRPLNEYLNLKNSFFFNWPTLNILNYIKKLGTLSSFILLFSIPITNSFYPIIEFPTQFILANIFVVINLLIFLLGRIYLGWSYVEERLFNPTVEYEESGWYDGQIWVKPVKVLKQDRLICSYKVFPILKRLEKTIVYFSVVSILIFLFTILF